ncbi:MAG: gluconeogenesis factor YvcK family protein [Minisyncoccia bacterium]|jgi:uncharacterized cofD-like protein
MKNIVTIGGGTGSFNVLGALKGYPVHLTAVVTMSDDGKSTGLLRDQYGVLPPGDVRRALVALSESSAVMRDLFNYRFENGGLGGYSFGSLFIATLEKVTGNFSEALKEASSILKIRGEVAPVTLDNIRLCARLRDGEVIRGEKNIDIPHVPHRPPIEKVWLEPAAHMNPNLRRIFKNADMIVIGPGDLYTSIIPNLLVRGVREEIKKSKAKKVFLCNLMTKRGETDNFTAEDFLNTIEKYLGKNVLDFAIFNKKRPLGRLLKKYEGEGARLVDPPRAPMRNRKPKYLVADVLDTSPFIRHGSPQKLGKLLFSLL